MPTQVSMEAEDDLDRSSVGTEDVLREGLGLGLGRDDDTSPVSDAKGDWKAVPSPPPPPAAAAAAAGAAPTAPAAETDHDGLKKPPPPPPPPTPTMTTLPAQPSSSQSLLALEAELLAKYDVDADANAAAASEVRFMVEAEWLRQWNGYVRGSSNPPGPLTNTALYDRRTQHLRLGLVEGVDYKPLTPTAFYILAILHGTADDDGSSAAATPPEICRCVPDWPDIGWGLSAVVIVDGSNGQG
jgi:hypothetical protein